MEWFAVQAPPVQALVAGTFTWAMTACGAASVFLFRRVTSRTLGAILGFAAGVMVAASFWSLLAPAIEIAEGRGSQGWAPALVGFLLGGCLIRLADLVLPHLHPRRDLREGLGSAWRRTTLLVTAITLHNVPEGLAIGVAFGAAALADSAFVESAGPTTAAAVVLALGIGIQNVPEGVAVSVPLRGEGFSRRRAFWYGQISGIVEPISAFVGALMVVTVRQLLPYALALAAGAMLFVVIEELIPESQSDVQHHDVATLSAMVGFAVMMTLDVALG